MIQEIITYAIVAAALVLAFYKTWKRFSRKRKAKKCASGPQTPVSESVCDSCPTGCELKDSATANSGVRNN